MPKITGSSFSDIHEERESFIACDIANIQNRGDVSKDNKSWFPI